MHKDKSRWLTTQSTYAGGLPDDDIDQDRDKYPTKVDNRVTREGDNQVRGLYAFSSYSYNSPEGEKEDDPLKGKHR